MVYVLYLPWVTSVLLVLVLLPLLTLFLVRRRDQYGQFQFDFTFQFQFQALPSRAVPYFQLYRRVEPVPFILSHEIHRVGIDIDFLPFLVLFARCFSCSAARYTRCLLDCRARGRGGVLDITGSAAGLAVIVVLVFRVDRAVGLAVAVAKGAAGAHHLETQVLASRHPGSSLSSAGVITHDLTLPSSPKL